MKRVLPYAAIGIAVLLGCDTPPAGNRVAVPVTAAADTAAAAAGTATDSAGTAIHSIGATATAAEAATKAAGEPSGRGFRMNGNQIVADTFEVRPTLRDGRLMLVLETDLGDDTEVFVSIARSYRVGDKSEDYIIEYFNEAGTVGGWRSGRTIDLSATDFWAEVLKLQRALARQGDPFVVASVSDSLKVDFTVYPGQNPPFESGNANLSGKAVSLSRGQRIIERDLVVEYPVGDALAGKPTR